MNDDRKPTKRKQFDGVECDQLGLTRQEAIISMKHCRDPISEFPLVSPVSVPGSVADTHKPTRVASKSYDEI
ncbi:hypothetical protein ACP70R_001139 [Stipagrostis hirtigluma subsp. patula]